MDTMTLQHVLAWLSVAAAVGPLVRLVWILWKEAFPKSIIVSDDKGQELGRFSAESVQDVGDDIARLRERIKRSHHVHVEAA